jgi:hypothetical protein
VINVERDRNIIILLNEKQGGRITSILLSSYLDEKIITALYDKTVTIKALIDKIVTNRTRLIETIKRSMNILESPTTPHQRTKLVRFGLFMFQLLVATLVTFLIASALHTQSVLSGLISVGAEIPLSLRIETVFIDFAGLLPTYGVIVFVGMLIAMSVALLIANKLLSASAKQTNNAQSPVQSSQLWLFSLAGAAAVFTLLSAMHPILDVSIIAGARGLSGLLTQSIAGAIGGLAFALLRYKLNKNT